MDHPFTIGHENGHSLGPKEGCEAYVIGEIIAGEDKVQLED